MEYHHQQQEKMEIRIEGDNKITSTNEEEKIDIKIEEGEHKEFFKSEFKHFDIIPTDYEFESISDHYYAYFLFSNGFSTTSSSISPSNYRKIVSEWKILEKNLPDSIYVRVYEGRIDLLRAVIIGPKGSPFHDGLYFFDIFLPSGYPNKPAEVMYRTYGLPSSNISNISVNPRDFKYEKGKNTSILLRILLSIQVKTLCEYRPGHYKFRNNCKRMLAVLENPPRHFEEFVAQHYRDRGDVILRACKAYMSGRAKIGDNPELFSTNNTQIVDVPKDFQKSMKSIYPELEKALIKNNTIGSSSSSSGWTKIFDHLCYGIPDHESMGVCACVAVIIVLGILILLFMIFFKYPNQNY